MKILIVDDLINIREYFEMIISNEKDMTVLGTAGSGAEAVRMAEQLSPDIVLMDIQMETNTAGIEAIKKIKRMNEKIKIIVLTIHEEDELLFKAYSAGAKAYIIKTDSVADIITSIRGAFNDTLSLKPQDANKILKEFSRLSNMQDDMMSVIKIVSNLTVSEYEIVKAVYEGKKYRQIAQERFVEEVTIRGHVNKILKKFKKRRMKDVVRLLREFQFFESWK
jgi:DNA-binding NarL/FixJ family response regulator